MRKDDINLATLLENIDIDRVESPVLRRVMKDRLMTPRDGKKDHNDHAQHSDHKEKYSDKYSDSCNQCHGDWHKDYIMTKEVRKGHY